MYPDNYPPGSRCQYVFYGQRSEKVRIRFEFIQLGNGDGRYVYWYRQHNVADCWIIIHCFLLVSMYQDIKRESKICGVCDL
jgi:hypothetical protein